jgi:hypothetical protein
MIAIVASLVLLLVVGCTQAIEAAPLPDDIKIVAPSGVPKERAVFSGRWKGAWTFYDTGVPADPGDGLPTALVVEQVRSKDATVVYAWGRGNDFEPGFLRTRASFERGALVMESSSGVKISFTVRKDGNLDGVYELRGQPNYAVLTRA